MKTFQSILDALIKRDTESARALFKRWRRNQARRRNWPAPGQIHGGFYRGVTTIHGMRAFFAQAERTPEFAGNIPESINGFCYVCNSEVEFVVDTDLIRQSRNWRETMKCPGCGLINRWRSSIHVFEALAQPVEQDRIYLTEAVTPLFETISKRHPNCAGSEYLADEPPGTEVKLHSGLIRNEDVTRLTFPEASFETVLSFDVLEHVPDFRKALAEFYRILVPGGQALISVPFTFLDQTVTRAELDSGGNIRHLEEPIFHGDPLSGDGVLCYYEFGLDFLAELKTAGFQEAYLLCFTSLELGYFDEHVMFVGRKKTWN